MAVPCQTGLAVTLTVVGLGSALAIPRGSCDRNFAGKSLTGMTILRKNLLSCQLMFRPVELVGAQLRPELTTPK